MTIVTPELIEAGDDAVVVRTAARLRGSPALPGDKSISHRALLLALLAKGSSRLSGVSDGEDVRTTARVIAALGARVERVSVDDGRSTYVVTSAGLDALREPSGVLDCGNSGTTTRLLAGVLAASGSFAVLDGDASLRSRPMGRIAEPLRRMGASIDGRAGGTLLPLAIRGRPPLTAIRHAAPVPSAQVKSAVLLAGLRASGRTAVVEAVATRDHTERMLRARGVTVRETTDGEHGHIVEIDGGAAVSPLDDAVPADVSAAAFWLVAGAAHADAELTLRDVTVNPTRRAVIDLLRRMGADIEERRVTGADARGDRNEGEPIGDLVVRSSALHAIDISPAEVAAAIDEIPILCLAAAVAAGTTTIRGAGELRHKESDRIAGIAAGLTSLGARIRVAGDDIEIEGGPQLRGATLETHDDHRLAMTFAIAGLIAEGETVVRRPGSAAISYPGFFSQLEGVRR
ncbi:MAG: 3-phosphoshikimate 1-carboxyvinyltransferase [Chloroflexota bacterium]